MSKEPNERERLESLFEDINSDVRSMVYNIGDFFGYQYIDIEEDSGFKDLFEYKELMLNVSELVVNLSSELNSYSYRKILKDIRENINKIYSIVNEE